MSKQITEGTGTFGLVAAIIRRAILDLYLCPKEERLRDEAEDFLFSTGELERFLISWQVDISLAVIIREHAMCPAYCKQLAKNKEAA